MVAMVDERAALAEAAPEPVRDLRGATPPWTERRPSLALRLGLLAAALVLGATLFSGSGAIRDEREREARRRHEHLVHVARLVAESVAPPAVTLDTDPEWRRWKRAERHRLEDAVHQTEIGALLIVGKDGAPVVSGGDEGARETFERLAPGEPLASADTPSAPGWRVVALDTPGARVEATAAVRRMQILSVSLGLGSGILIFIVVHALLEPVDRMARDAAAAARSGVPGRWVEEGLPEFVALARTLNALGDAVRQREEALRRAADEDIRRERAWARALVGSSPIGVVLLGEDGSVLDHNAGAAWAIGERRRLVDAVEAGARGALPGEPVVVRGPGDRLTRLLRVPGRAGGHVLFAEDLSEQRRVQAELAAAREQALTGGLAAMVAHEVRNPVHALSLHLRLLERAPDADARAEVVGLVRGELTALTGVVDMFLDFARMDAARREDIDAAALVDAVLHRLRPVWSTVRLVATNGPVPARLDRGLVELALVNLVSNACQAITGAGRGGEVRVEATRRDSSVVLAVEDDGPGVDPALADRLFEPFVTGRATGTGLGLAVVRRAAQAHGGEAHILLGRSGGARFEIIFPDSVPAPRGSLG
jgi:two-component system, sensor histidine kinase FlrB